MTHGCHAGRHHRHAAREEWRARHAERREAWRRAWRERHGAHDCGRGDGSHIQNTHNLSGAEAARMAEMEKTVAGLSERIKVLERIVVTDEARLAAEIERLRNSDAKGE